MREKPDSWRKPPGAGAADDRLRVPPMEPASVDPDLATVRCSRCGERLPVVTRGSFLCSRCRRWAEELVDGDER